MVSNRLLAPRERGSRAGGLAVALREALQCQGGLWFGWSALRREIDSVAGRVNGRYAEFDWAPVRYLIKSFSRGTLAGFYRLARVGFVAPLRDGMNLVAKEYVAAQNAQDPGVLILSRFAGAARELETALIVNPFDLDSLADALHRGLTMPLSERIARWEPMFDALCANPIDAWCDRFLAVLEERADPAAGVSSPVERFAAVA
jgi:trehalose 6-phosphate synthase